MSQITPFDFVGTPIDNVNNNIQFPASIFPRSYEKIYFKDSIFKFYPIGELNIDDEVGIFMDKVFFVEGLEWNFKLGSFDEKIVRDGKEESLGYLKHNYIWSESQFFAKKQSTHLSGVQSIFLISAYFMDDTYNSKIFSNTTISDTVRQTISNYQGLTSQKIFISNTSGISNWYKLSIFSKTFLENLSLIAYQNNTSPFFTFFNCNGDFYFMSLYDMLRQKPIGTYTLKFEPTAIVDPWVIQDYKIMQGGLPVNRPIYYNTVYNLDQDGTINSETAELKNYYLKQTSKDKFTIRNKTIDQKTRSIQIGLLENTEIENFKGKINNLFINTNLNYRMGITIRFNPQAVAGKVINMSIDRADTNLKFQEFSGNWIIAESEHFCSQDGIPFSKLLLCKPSINITQKNPFWGEFI